VTLHAALVTLVDAELQGIISWRCARSVGEAGFPGLDGRGIDGGASDTGLEEYGVDICLLILVEDADEVATLLFWRSSLWPVQTLKRGEPYGPHLMLRRLGRDVQSQRK
jgi:hypothetical protein